MRFGVGDARQTAFKLTHGNEQSTFGNATCLLIGFTNVDHKSGRFSKSFACGLQRNGRGCRLGSQLKSEQKAAASEFGEEFVEFHFLKARVVDWQILRGQCFDFKANDVAADLAELHADQVDGLASTLVFVGIAFVLNFLQRPAFGR